MDMGKEGMSNFWIMSVRGPRCACWGSQSLSPPGLVGGIMADGKAKQVPFQPELCVLGLGSEVPTACCLCLTSVHGKWWRSEGREPPAEVCVSTIPKVTVHSHFQ